MKRKIILSLFFGVGISVGAYALPNGGVIMSHVGGPLSGVSATQKSDVQESTTTTPPASSISYTEAQQMLMGVNMMKGVETEGSAENPLMSDTLNQIQMKEIESALLSNQGNGLRVEEQVEQILLTTNDEIGNL